ncbi:MAG: UDP-N-acetylmuramoyl-tripeptide--D-alanyl-D-alanine ligase [Gammaproteobacteria bacterium]|nr:UDP-N-acetylmuramoyl-tripeptide--D-alanyl-D-alanine ligase [Gammaproteobacteria bacterium]
MTLGELARLIGGELRGADRRFDAVGTDTRTLGAGALFVALQGRNFDAHGFLAVAAERGAVAALVQRDVETALPVVRVADTRIALGRLASAWRGRFAIPLVAVTGSNGKTTVKGMLASVLAVRGAGLSTRGNLNNDLGVPLTLLHLRREHRSAVIEMGANRPGDIEYLTGLARPTVALITNAAPAHLAGFGDIAGVARAKGEIFSGLAPGGCAVINADDPREGLWRVMAAPHRIVSFGLRYPADVTARDLHLNDALGCSFTLITPAGEAAVELRLAGRHNVMNALAAAAAAHAVGIDVADIAHGLESMRAVERRLQPRRGLHGARVIDDTYNANPGSVKAALEVLAVGGADGEKILVLGDMGELGNAGQALHEQVGRQARAIGVSRVYAVGELARTVAGAFGKGAVHYPDQDALIAALRADLAGLAPAPVTVLVKGSRSMRMECVVDAVTFADEAAGVAGTVGPGGPAPARQAGLGG